MKILKSLSIAFFIAVTVCFSLSGWSETAKTLDIGIVTPLTGPAADVGNTFKNSVLIAIEEQNAKGGVTIAGTKYLLKPIIRDDKFDPVTAKSIAEEMVYDKKVKIIFGPTQVEGPNMSPITLANKVILFAMLPVPDMTGPDKPYNFFASAMTMQMYPSICEYTKKYYPNAKKVISIYADLPDAKPWFMAAEMMLTKYGFTYLGHEQFPASTNDFAPFMQKVLRHNPEIVDFCGSGGAMGAICGLMTKQLRQAGYKGIILMPTEAPPGIMNTVPREYLNKIVTAEINIDSPIVSKAYRDLFYKYIKKFGNKPIGMLSNTYNATHAFFTFLDGQKTMDTTEWVKGFENYKWTGVFGEKARWLGKPIFGINRELITHIWASEWKNGKLETNFTGKIPYELYESK